jgi:preprotein translocase subunit SecA
MKQIDNRQKKQIQMKASSAPKKGNLFGHKKEKTRIPESSSNEPETPETPSVPAAPVSKEPKVGRNDPCPCGSGKKFKKCCLLKSDIKN